MQACGRNGFGDGPLNPKPPQPWVGWAGLSRVTQAHSSAGRRDWQRGWAGDGCEAQGGAAMPVWQLGAGGGRCDARGVIGGPAWLNPWSRWSPGRFQLNTAGSAAVNCRSHMPWSPQCERETVVHCHVLRSPCTVSRRPCSDLMEPAVECSLPCCWDRLPSLPCGQLPHQSQTCSRTVSSAVLSSIEHTSSLCQPHLIPCRSPTPCSPSTI